MRDFRGLGFWQMKAMLTLLESRTDDLKECQYCMFQIINFRGMVFSYLYISFFPLVVSFMFVNAPGGYQGMAPFNKYNK